MVSGPFKFGNDIQYEIIVDPVLYIYIYIQTHTHTLSCVLQQRFLSAVLLFSLQYMNNDRRSQVP